MKYIVLVPDGLCDYPLKELENRTPLEVARTTNLDHMAQNGSTGLVATIPPNMTPGSDVGNLALMGYDPRKCYSGRAPLEAANLGIKLSEDQIAFRCNLVTIDEKKMVDYSAGHIGTQQAEELIRALNKRIKVPDVKFYAGKSYRHILVIKTKFKSRLAKIKCTPPHDILGQSINDYLPKGGNAQILLNLMERSKDIFRNHAVNTVRLDLKENPANMIWLWGQGIQPKLQSFFEKFAVKGSVISAVDLVNGIGKLIGLSVIKVPNVTGYYDTNYAGKAEYALKSLKTKDFVFIHVEATDEAGHNGDIKMKISCIERIDKEIVGTILNHFDKYDDYRLLVLPDHATPIVKRSHVRDPVCFVMYGKGIPKDEAPNYGETAAMEKGLKYKSGEELMQYFMRRYTS